MIKEEIIEMAEQAGFMFTDGSPIGFTVSMLKDFAKLIAEKEREECASLCEMNSHNSYDMAKVLEEAIRARGQ